MKYVNTSDCIPMPELDRKYYDQSNFFFIKNVIQKDGFDSAYPIRGIYNKEKEKFEIFDGIHRLKVAEALEIKKIPFIDDTGILSRTMAIAKGIKANKSHAAYNPMDIAYNIKALSEEILKYRNTINKKKGFISETEINRPRGRPAQYDLSAIANYLQMRVEQVSEYLSLLKLPEDVQNLMGQGKLRITYALILLKLYNTPYASKISSLARDCIAKGWGLIRLESIVKSIISKGSYQEDAKLCGICKKPFSLEQRSPFICSNCFNEAKNIKEENTREYMKKYLKFNNHAEEMKKQGKIITPKLQDYLDELHRGWLGKNIDQPSYIR
jgi:ParB-like chromosome segregation protein Spo0J